MFCVLTCNLPHAVWISKDMKCCANCTGDTINKSTAAPPNWRIMAGLSVAAQYILSNGTKSLASHLQAYAPQQIFRLNTK